MPVAAAGILYLLPVLLASSLWGLASGSVPRSSAPPPSTSSISRRPASSRSPTSRTGSRWAVFFAAAAVTSTLAGAARGAREEAERAPPRGRPDRRDGAGPARRPRPRGLAAGRRPADRHGVRPALGRGRARLGGQRRRAGARCRSSSRASRSAPSLVPATPTRGDRGARGPRRPLPRDAADRGARARASSRPRSSRRRRCAAANVVKTALLRSVSHDLRSPLTAITAAAGGLGSPTLNEEARARAGRGDRDRERSG